MADIKQMMQALRNADAAGDTEAATRIAGMIKAAGPQAQPTAQPQQTPLQWSDVPGQALSNIPSSAAKFGGDIYEAVRHPIDTLETVSKLGAGALQNVLPESFVNVVNQAGDYLSSKGLVSPNDPNEKEIASKVGEFFSERYGTEEGFKQALANDPVSVMADVSTVLTGGGAIAARAPGLAGRAGQIAKTAGRAVDPINVAARGAGVLGSKVVAPLVKNVLGTTTGAGGQAIQEAAKAGVAGGQTGRAFTDQMRGIAPVEDVVNDAKFALNQMKQERAATYRAGMGDIKQDATIIDFNPIDKAVNKVAGMGTFKGETIRPNVVGAMDDISKAVDEWKNLPPEQFHTPEGLDALKQKVGDIGSSFDPMTQKQSRVVADQVYNSIKSEISKQAPEYANVMKDYERSSELIGDIEKTLSVNPKANVDTTVRKLQSVMRNNANTNYGRREGLAKKLSDMGAPNLMPRLGGQSLSSAMPRGLQGAVAVPTAAGAALTNPAMLPMMLATSPRVVGEAAYYGGRGASMGNRAAQMAAPVAGVGPRIGAYQSGRLANELRRN